MEPSSDVSGRGPVGAAGRGRRRLAWLPAVTLVVALAGALTGWWDVASAGPAADKPAPGHDHAASQTTEKGAGQPGKVEGAQAQSPTSQGNTSGAASNAGPNGAQAGSGSQASVKNGEAGTGKDGSQPENGGHSAHRAGPGDSAPASPASAPSQQQPAAPAAAPPAGHAAAANPPAASPAPSAPRPFVAALALRSSGVASAPASSRPGVHSAAPATAADVSTSAQPAVAQTAGSSLAQATGPVIPAAGALTPVPAHHSSGAGDAGIGYLVAVFLAAAMLLGALELRSWRGWDAIRQRPPAVRVPASAAAGTQVVTMAPRRRGLATSRPAAGAR